MDRDAAIDLQKRNLRGWIEAMAEFSPGARLFDRDGVVAFASPACPERSIANSVSYDDAEVLARRLDDLAAFYDDAGVDAWTVWLPESDATAVATLEKAGHAFDGNPAAMSLDLRAWEEAGVGDLEWEDDPPEAELGRVNDAAYGLEPAAGVSRAMSTPPERARVLRATVAGETACVLATVDIGSDLGFYFVATDPAYRGRGLCSRLMSVALADAKRRGLETSSLQASKLGEPVYARLGFERDFALNMYERRAP